MTDEAPIAAWRTDVFTDEERSMMVAERMAEIADCIKDYARNELENESLIDLMAYIDPDIEVTVELLQAIRDGHACMADYESGEFGHHATSATHMRRFKLVDEAGEKLTEFGEQYLGEYL